MILAHRIALDPTVKQRIFFAKACGCSRFAWNWALAEWGRQYKEGGKPTALSINKEWNSIKKVEFPWVFDSPKDANHRPSLTLGKAFSSFFKKKSRYPKFKKKGVHDSFYLSNDQFRLEGSKIRIPRLGWVRMRQPLRFEGKIVAATVSREADKWFVSIQVETEVAKYPTAAKSIGVDLGINTAIVCSNGESFKAPKPLKKNLKTLKRASRRFSKKKKGSQNRNKAKKLLAKVHVRVKNIRLDWTHKVTSKLVHENQVICIEDLNVKGMVKNRHLSRALSDIGFGEIRRQLTYKSEMRGRTLVAVNRWFPSSKMCSQCGYVKEKLPLSTREYSCAECGLFLDRDLNAAKNINTAGLAEIKACGLKGSGSVDNATKPCQDEAGTKTLVETLTS